MQLAVVNQICRITGRLQIPSIFILFCILTLNCFGATVYVADNSSGDGSGSSPSNRRSVASINAGWNIKAGDTLSLGGTIQNTLGVFGSGTSDSPITLLFETDAKMARANGRLIYMNNVNYIVIDGGANGILENTATGTGMAYSNAAGFIDASGAGNLTFKNLHLQNQYVHTSITDANPDIAAAGGIYANGLGGDNYFISDTFSNVGWCLEILASPKSMTVSNCFFINYDHGVVPGGTNIAIINNHFDSTANWDTTANVYHHDPIHYFGAQNTASFVIAGNLFTGNLGRNNTAMIYLESGPPNVLMYNNVFLQYPSNYLNNGMVQCYGDNSRIYNNTFAGSGVANSSGLTTGGRGTIVQNNLFNSLTTFVYVPSVVPVFNNNVYANWASGGNSPWATNGASYGSLAAWQGSVGDAKSVYTTAAVINANGTLISSSVALGAGANLSGIFTTDIKGLTRTAKWDAGAYQYATNTVSPPINLHPQ